MLNPKDLEFRIRRLEDRAEIGELIARYCVAMDERDIEEFRNIFTPDVVIRSADGVMHAAGMVAVTAMFRGRFEVLGPSNHFTHDVILKFDEHDPHLAQGVVSSHAEMNRRGMAMMAAMRYRDNYKRCEGCWLFSERLLSFFYYVPAAEYIESLQGGLSRRMRAYAEPRAADWPEQSQSWKRYYGV